MFSKTSSIGNQTELMFDLIACKRGWIVGYPCNLSDVYDRLVSDDNMITWKKVQVKTGYCKKKSIQFKTSSVKGSGAYHNKIDYIAVLADNKMYMFPESLWGHTSGSSSITKDRAVDYCIGSIEVDVDASNN